jgi:hypothetical protein
MFRAPPPARAGCQAAPAELMGDPREDRHPLIRLGIDQGHIFGIAVFGQNPVELNWIGDHGPIPTEPPSIEPPGILGREDQRRHVGEAAGFVVAEDL